MQNLSSARSTLVFARTIAAILLSSFVGRVVRVALETGLADLFTIAGVFVVAAVAVILWLWLWQMADDGTGLPRRLQALLYPAASVLGLLLGAF